jgi:hypothetical protein
MVRGTTGKKDVAVQQFARQRALYARQRLCRATPHGKDQTAKFSTATTSLPCTSRILHGKGFAVRRFLCRALIAFAVRAAFAVRHEPLPCGLPLPCAVSKYRMVKPSFELKKFTVCHRLRLPLRAGRRRIRVATHHRARPSFASLCVTAPGRCRVQVAARQATVAANLCCVLVSSVAVRGLFAVR